MVNYRKYVGHPFVGVPYKIKNALYSAYQVLIFYEVASEVSFWRGKRQNALFFGRIDLVLVCGVMKLTEVLKIAEECPRLHRCWIQAILIR